jgi:hypothetical protein
MRNDDVAIREWEGEGERERERERKKELVSLTSIFCMYLKISGGDILF